MILKPTYTLPWPGGDCCCYPPYGIDVACCPGVVLPDTLYLTWAGADSIPASGIPRTFPLVSIPGIGGWGSQQFDGTPILGASACNLAFLLGCNADGNYWELVIKGTPLSEADIFFPLATGPILPGILSSCSPFLLDVDTVVAGISNGCGPTLTLWPCQGSPDCAYTSFGTITHITITR